MQLNISHILTHGLEGNMLYDTEKNTRCQLYNMQKENLTYIRNNIPRYNKNNRNVELTYTLN